MKYGIVMDDESILIPESRESERRSCCKEMKGTLIVCALILALFGTIIVLVSSLSLNSQITKLIASSKQDKMELIHTSISINVYINGRYTHDRAFDEPHTTTTTKFVPTTADPFWATYYDVKRNVTKGPAKIQFIPTDNDWD